LHNKGNNHQSEDMAYRKGEKFCQLFDKGVISRIYKELKNYMLKE
jgi:hypothetical protein